MDWYHVALFVHFFALFMAVAAFSRVGFFAVRRAKASTVRDVLEWHLLLMKAAKIFPVAIVLLVLTGSYMVTASAQTWSAGFVNAGLAGVVLLLSSGIVLTVKGRVLAKLLQQRIAAGEGDHPPALRPDVVAATLLHTNFAIVLAVMFDMTLKPTAADALGVLALAIGVSVVGSVIAVARRKAAAATAGISPETQRPS